MHTKGEWKALIPKKDKYKDCWWVYCKGKGYIAKVYGNAGHSPIEPKEIEANAHLIAAAPDLLEACKVILDSDINNKCLPKTYRTMLEQAIAKAEGSR